MSKAAELAKIGEVATNSQIGGRRNIVINGAMQVAQRSASVTGLGAATGYFTLDRWEMTEGAASAGRFTMSQSAVTDLAGFPNALKIDCTTVDTSIAAGEQLTITQKIEGLNLQQLKSTSTSTKAFTVSYYAKSDASRAVALEILMAEGTNKQISVLHTIGTSWARYSMTVPAASSTELDNDNTEAMQVNLWLHGGATFTGGTLNTASLAASTDANRAAGIGSIFATTNNVIEVTGFQIEIGNQVTPFEHRSFGEELALCQRYLYVQREDTSTGDGFFGTGQCNNTTVLHLGFPHSVPMRLAHGSTFIFDTVTDYRVQSAGGLDVCSAMGGVNSSPNTSLVFATVSSGLVAGDGGNLIIAANSPVEIKIDSELP